MRTIEPNGGTRQRGPVGAAGTALVVMLLAVPPPADAQGLVEYAESEKGLSLTLSDGFQRSHLDDGKLTSRVNVGQVAEALLITGFGTFSSAEVVCAAAAVVGNRVSVHVSRTFSVRGGQTAPAGKHCISSEGFIPGGDGFLSPGDTFDFGRSKSTLDGDHFLMDELMDVRPAEFDREFAKFAKQTILGTGNNGLVMAALPAVQAAKELGSSPLIIRFSGDRR